MKKFLINISIFIAIVAVVDISLGKTFYWLQSTKAKGRTQTEYYICNELNADILVMGSSRATHHYVAQMISDSLGKTCFNGGQDGNGIVLQYGRWKMISKHHLPKVIIYDIEPNFDLLVDDNSRYIDRLKPYSVDKDVNKFVAELFPMERFKMLSGMYRYNYKFFEIASDCMRPSDTYNGYIPNYKQITNEMVKRGRSKNKIEINPVDPVKIECLGRFLTEAKQKGVQVILISSPYWKGHDDFDLNAVKRLAANMNVPYIDYADSELRENPDWFADSMHLNNKGAIVFTADVINRIKNFCGI